jgi:hypothetical protein
MERILIPRYNITMEQMETKENRENLNPLMNLLDHA